MEFYIAIKKFIRQFIDTIFNFDRKKAYEIYHKGMCAYNQRDFVSAIEYFKCVIDNNAISGSMEYDLSKFYYSQAHRNIGIIQFAKGNNKEALIHFKTALKFNPEHSDLNYFIGICLNNIGQFKDAVEAFKKLQMIDPDNVPNKLKIAIIFYNLGMWEHAEQIQREILQENPGYADVHYYLGLSLICQGKLSESIDSFKEALNINPNYTNARLKLGVAEACLGKFQDALASLNSIIEKYPDYADVYYLIGLVKQETNEIEESVQYFHKVLTINSNFTKAKLKLIMSYCKLGKVDKAKRMIEEFIMLHPDDASLNKLISVKQRIDRIVDIPVKNRVNIIDHYCEIFEKDEIITELYNEFHKDLHIIPSFSEIISLFTNFKYVQQNPNVSKIMIPLILEQIHKNPTYPDLYNSLGLQYLFAGQNIEAETAFAKAVELNPNYITARINLLKVLIKNGKYEQAYENGEILLSKNVSFPDVYYTISENLLLLKRYDEALIYAGEVIKIKPSMIKIHLLIARIYEKQKKYDLAKQEIDKYLSSNADIELAEEAHAILERLKEKT